MHPGAGDRPWDAAVLLSPPPRTRLAAGPHRWTTCCCRTGRTRNRCRTTTAFGSGSSCRLGSGSRPLGGRRRRGLWRLLFSFWNVQCYRCFGPGHQAEGGRQPSAKAARA